MTYKVTLIYDDERTQVFRDVFSINICGTTVDVFDIKENYIYRRDGKKINFIQIASNEQTIVRKTRKA